MPAVTFHVLSDTAPDAHLRLSCRLAEQAVDDGKRVFIRTSSSEETRRLDDLLWTFGDRSFLPHEVASSASHVRVRILLGEQDPPQGAGDLLINFSSAAPSNPDAFAQIAEIVVADEERKRQARERFKFYRDRGLQPQSQNV
jgi:DNA polymerase-3 subunit chi